MFKKLAFAGAASMIALSTYGVTEMDFSEKVPLKDGATLYMFTDVKMGMEDHYGRAVLLPENRAVEARDGASGVMLAPAFAQNASSTAEPASTQWDSLQAGFAAMLDHAPHVGPTATTIDRRDDWNVECMVQALLRHQGGCGRFEMPNH